MNISSAQRVLELAKEAGFDIDEGLFPFEASEDKFIGTERTLEAFAALVAARKAEIAMAEAYRCGYEAGAAHEREACAKVCEETKAQKIRDEWSAGQITGCSSCAAAIRARSQIRGEK